MSHSISRRRFLETTLFAGATGIVASRLAFANAPGDARFVFVLLRGALDGLYAVASPYRERSHFDGQNVLESGGLRPHQTESGWLNRAISALQKGGQGQGGVALGANVPLAMRGPAEVASWSPTKISALDDETLARITDLYARDPLLSRRLAEALESDAIANEAQAAANAEPDADP